VTLASAGAVSSATSGVYALTITNATGTGLGNYAVVYSDSTLTVTNRVLTITAANTNKLYGATFTFITNSPSSHFTVVGLTNSDSVASVELTSAGATNTAAVGDYVITVTNAAGTGLGNYSITYSNGVLSVTNRPLTITATAQSKLFGATLTAGAGYTRVTPSGLQNGETIGSVTVAYTNGGGAAAEPVGVYTNTISISAVTGGTFNPVNYGPVTYVPGNLTILAGAPGSLTVTADWIFSRQKGWFLGTLTVSNGTVATSYERPFRYVVPVNSDYWLQYPDGTTAAGDPYVDITAGVLSSLQNTVVYGGNGDDVLNPGEWAVVTGVELVQRIRTEPKAFVEANAVIENYEGIPVVIRPDGSSVYLEWISVTNREYLIEQARSLSLPFSPLTGYWIPATPPLNRELLPPGSNGFYRVMLRVRGSDISDR
jgi:hypothetical protein